MPPEIGPYGGRHDIRAHGERRAEAQPPVPVPQAGQLFPQEGVVVLNRLRGLQQQAARLGQHRLFPLVGKQPDAVCFLKLMDMAGDAGLGDVQFLRRPGEIHMAAHREKGMDTKIQHRRGPLSS